MLDVTALDLSARCSDPLDDGSIRPASWETFSLLTSLSLINLSFKLLTSQSAFSLMLMRFTQETT